MRIVQLAILAFVLVAGQGRNRFRECRNHFLDMIKKNQVSAEITSKENLTAFVKTLVQQFNQIWNEKCKEEIVILVERNGDSSAELYYGNQELFTNIQVLKQQSIYANNLLTISVRYQNILVEYLERFKSSLIAAFRNAKDDICQRYIKQLEGFRYTESETNQLIGINLVFNAFEYCIGV
eukprot:TRINITY_DN11353_c0_g1_i2.p1 TRINITY_DN11353_c0_g1~~TRINITY_DN11353_c0_g1_i2.p1  ORF type:complete len:180 (+),score=23.98 TRINITY_DN11353_c0_g1_i2:60-599(+)